MLTETTTEAPTIEEYPERNSRSGLITSLIGGALALSGVAFLLLRNSTVEIQRTTADSPITTPAPPLITPDKAPATTPTPGESPVAPAAPTVKFLFVATTSPNPLAAWSTRKLVGPYTGPLVRVRRSSDQNESDIPATSDGSLDTTALDIFVGNNHAHVVCWYDQSGNNHHLRQPEREKQPRLVTNGILNRENSRPVITFDRTRFDHLATPAGIPIGCLFAVLKVVPYADGTQALMGSMTKNTTSTDAYYPILDRSGKGMCEWWIGQMTDFPMVIAPITRNRLLIWQSSSDGGRRPKLALRLDDKEVGTISATQDILVPSGPTVVGAGYWERQLGDPFGGSLGELVVLPAGSSRERQAKISAGLKSWWKTP